MFQIIKTQSLVLLMLAMLNATVSGAYLDYEAPCSPSDTENACDASKFLKCIDNTCLCNGTMAWDVKDVARCSLKLDQGCPMYPSFRGPFCYGTAACQESGDNSREGICTCLSPDEPSPNGEYCIHLARNVGEYCTQDGVTCSTTDALICSSIKCTCESGWLVNSTVCMAGFDTACKVASELPIETCRSNNLLKCNPETERCECSRGIDHVWHEDTEICLTRAGASCEYENVDHYGCIEKANCRIGPNGVGRICTCNQYHHPSPDGTECVQDPVEKILASGDLCDPENLVEVCNYAKDNVCSCPYQNFTCFCDCETPSLINSRGECQAGYEARCENSPNTPINMTCNEEAYLKCHQTGENFTCGCDSPLAQFYDPLLKKCQLLVGQECDPNPDNKISCPRTSICRKTDGGVTRCWCEHDYKPSDDETKCIYNSNPKYLLHGAECQEWNYLEFCPQSWNLFCLDGTCQCPEGGFVWSGKNRSEGCYPQYNMPCKPGYTYVNLTCDAENKFTCTNNTCQCFSTRLYEDDNGRNGCFLKVGQACDVTDEDPFPCVSNTTCKAVTGSSKYCGCNEGFTSEWEEEIDGLTCTKMSTAGVDLASPFSFLIIFATFLCKMLSFDGY